MAIINLGITEPRRGDMIIGALEGGSNYWYLLSEEASTIIDAKTGPEKLNEPLSVKMWEAIKNGATIPIHDIETEEKIGEINLQSIEEGEQLMADNHIDSYMRIVAEEDDASDADIWFQYCTLKELVYG